MNVIAVMTLVLAVASTDMQEFQLGRKPRKQSLPNVENIEEFQLGRKPRKQSLPNVENIEVLRMNTSKDIQPSAPMLEHDIPIQAGAPPSYEEAVSGASGVPYPVSTGSSNVPYPVIPGPAPGFVPQGNFPVAANVPLPPGQAVAPPQPINIQPQVIVQGPVMVGPKPAKIRCPVCLAHIKTSIQTENQSGAHIACIILCLLGCCLCSCIPYCMDSCKKVRHSCPNCKCYLGTYVA